jgi:adenosylhomocysteine nucleosidase
MRQDQGVNAVSRQRIALLAPMVSEVRPLVKRGSLQPGEIAGVRVATGRAGDNDIVATKVGIGTERSARATERLLDTGHFDRVIVVGIAGGVGSIPIAELVFPETVIDGQSGKEYKPEQFDGVVPRGGLSTSDELHVDDEMLRDFAERGVIALDMETSAVAEVCTQRGVPWAVVRSISDIAGESPTDDSLLELAGPDGKPKIGPSLRYLATNPRRVPKLVGLARDSARAANAAAAAALRLSASL